ncbi:serine hydrolase [Massilia horti]|uniref:Serine hydrolase n=1 Tax=Massilia horti TaxID=2562153 RepID=A0A4Y9SYN9_9BURK|nr:serine hydrolase [Massilia horti]TFW31962.1 serine hydrolase [Massilia horti]
MRLKALVCASVFVMLVCDTSASYAQDSTRLDQIVQSYVDDNNFTGAVLVARDNKVLLNKGYGEANREWAIPNGPDTKFRIASVSKQFTAAAILVLAERGKLNVDDKVSSYIPDAPASWKDITIFHLLTNTSGIPDFTGFPNFSAIQATPTTAAKTIASFRDKPLEFTPGERFKYSSSGYVLLGYLIEKISNQSYEQFLQDAIFTPLGMKNSGYDRNATVMAHRASGYTMTKAGVENSQYTDMSLPYAAGALYSTTQDLLRWQRALYGGKFLSPQSLKRMTTAYKDDYAFGLDVISSAGVQEISHDGHIQGFRSFIGHYPASNVDVIILGNLDGRANTPLMQHKLAKVAAGGTVVLHSERKEIPVAVSTLKKYEGTYRLMGEKYTLEVRGDKLWAGGNGKWRWQQLKAESDSVFFYEHLKDVSVEVIRDNSGNATSIVMHNLGKSYPAPQWVD